MAWLSVCVCSADIIAHYTVLEEPFAPPEDAELLAIGKKLGEA